MNLRNARMPRRLLWVAGAAAVTGGLLLLPIVERAAEANGGVGVRVEPTPLPLIVVQAAPTPAPVVGPRLNPPPIEHTNVLLPVVVYDQLLSPPPLAAQEANAAADAVREAQEAPGRGITTGTSPIASGITLFAPKVALRITYLPVQAPAAAAVAAAPAAAAPAQTSAAVGQAVAQPGVQPVAPIVVAPLPTVAAPRTIQSPARLGLPDALPTAPLVPVAGIRDPGVALTQTYHVQVPVLSIPTVTLTGQGGAASATAPVQAPAAAAPAIPSAHTPPVIVVEPGGAAVPIGAPVATVGTDGGQEGSAIVCNNFNQASRWASHRESSPTDMWSDWYAGWGPFAVDDGLYQARNVTFSLEQAVGPGSNAGPNEHSAKIASNQPYAAGFGSPLFGVPPGALITVSVNYLIYDHNDHGYDYDWASLGVKPEAYGDEATYANGYVRGQWATLSNSVYAGATGRIMVLLQAQSPGALNSNIYFDNVRIWIDGAPVVDCSG